MNLWIYSTMLVKITVVACCFSSLIKWFAWNFNTHTTPIEFQINNNHIKNVLWAVFVRWICDDGLWILTKYHIHTRRRISNNNNNEKKWIRQTAPSTMINDFKHLVIGCLCPYFNLGVSLSVCVCLFMYANAVNLQRN